MLGLSVLSILAQEKSKQHCQQVVATMLDRVQTVGVIREGDLDVTIRKGCNRGTFNVKLGSKGRRVDRRVFLGC